SGTNVKMLLVWRKCTGLGRQPSCVKLCSPALMKPELDDHSVDGNTDTERDPEELVRAQMRECTCGEEHSHYETSGCDTEQANYSAGYPLALCCPVAATAQPIGTAQR